MPRRVSKSSISVPGHRFSVEYKSSASAGPLASAVHQLKRSAEADQEQGLPLIVVPYMGHVGRGLCEKSGVSWLDLSGNAQIVAPGLRIRIEGRPNKYRDRGRPPNLFAPKSSRVVRQLLFQPQRFQTQAGLARQIGLDDGYVSKIVRRLELEHFVEANDDGAVRPRDPHLLLDAWHGVYDFRRHRVMQGHVPARSGDELLQRIANQFSQENLAYAATGLARHGSLPVLPRFDSRPSTCRRCRPARCSRKSSSRRNRKEPMSGLSFPMTKAFSRAVRRKPGFNV